MQLVAGLLLTALIEMSRASSTCDVRSYGAVGDGKHNDTTAIASAIEACRKDDSATLLFPAGYSFLTWPIHISSANEGFRVQVDGEILAPSDPKEWPTPLPDAFIKISTAPSLALNGSGTINGQGSAWWDIRRKDPSQPAPMLVILEDSSQVTVTNVKLKDSPKFHLVLSNIAGVVVDGASVEADKSSPNTDAIDPGDGTTDVVIRNFYAANGDDGVAIKAGTSNVLVEDSQFFYGHGVSIGSLGEDGASHQVVTNVTVRNCSFTETMYGCRVKTWQGGTGLVRNITYDNVRLDKVKTGILIDQYYCPSSQHHKPCQNSSRAVNITDVSFLGVVGSVTDEAITLHCSDSSPCANVLLENVDVTGGDFSCWQVYGQAKNVTPKSCLWGPTPPRGWDWHGGVLPV